MSLALVDALERRVKSREVFCLKNGFFIGQCVGIKVLELLGCLFQLMGYVALRQVRKGRTRSCLIKIEGFVAAAGAKCGLGLPCFVPFLPLAEDGVELGDGGALWDNVRAAHELVALEVPVFVNVEKLGILHFGKG